MMNAGLGDLEVAPTSPLERSKASCERSAAEWDRIAAGFLDVDLFQTASFCDPLRGRHRTRQFLVGAQARALGGAYVGIMTLPAMKRGVAYVKHGPFWRRSEDADIATYNDIVRGLIAEYADAGGHMLTISPRPHPLFQKLEIEALQSLGFRYSAPPFRKVTYFLVNTSAPEAELRASLSQGWRKKLKSAEKTEVKIRACAPAEGLERFFPLYDQMVARKQFRDRSPRLVLPPILDQLPNDCTHLFLAERGTEAVAAAVVFIGGDSAFYLYGASSDAALKLNAGYLLQWRIAAWLRERGLAWYNLGDGFGGIGQFKAGFVGTLGVTLPSVELSYSGSRRSWLTGSSIYQGRRIAGAAQHWARTVRKKLGQR